MAHVGYGLPLKCPKCPPKEYYGFLKTPGNKSHVCPNCGSTLVATRKRSVADRPGHR